MRWLDRHSPLRGCSGLAALAKAKIPRRRTPRNFQTRSENALAEFGEGWFIIGRSRLWWNWQTRYFEVVVGQPVQVQVLLSAPFSFGQ